MSLLTKKFLFLFIPLLLATNACNNKTYEAESLPVNFDLKKIRARGSLRAIVDNNSTSYFIYKGQTMGYEYELLDLFANRLGVELDLLVVTDIEDAFRKLNSGEGDILAYNLTITNERQKKVAFARHHTEVKQVLVQRKPDRWRKLKRHETEKRLVRNPIGLIGKNIHVRKNSASHTRLINLSDEIGGGINIVVDSAHVGTEEQIRWVAEGKFDFTIADENIAKVNAAYYPDIDVATAVSFPQRIAWAARKNAPDLIEEINQWIVEIKGTSDYHTIYNKYFKSSRASARRVNSGFSSINDGQISPFDDLIKKAADTLGWDWRLLAAQMFKESKFDAKAKSWAGALGLMQLVPNTASSFGATDPMRPEQNIKAATNYLLWLDALFSKKIPNIEQRRKFVLASYNIGQGHVLDAMALTNKNKEEANQWQNVEKYLILKSKSTYYNDPVVKYGYCRGQEAANYVHDILNQYEHYSRLM